MDNNITEIIEQLEDELIIDSDAMLEINKSSLNPDGRNLMLQTNRAGAIKLAIALLNSINNTPISDQNIVHEDIEELASIAKGDFVINRIETEYKSREKIEYKETLKDKLVGYGIVMALSGILLWTIYGVFCLLRAVFGVFF